MHTHVRQFFLNPEPPTYSLYFILRILFYFFVHFDPEENM